MKLDHLTFAQLYKLAQPETLMRVERVYHHRLRLAWEQLGMPHGVEFSVTAAERLFPGTAARYAGVLDFLKGHELKRALRHAADRTPIETYAVKPSVWAPVRVIQARRYRNPSVRAALADLIEIHCRNGGIPTQVRGHGNGDLTVCAPVSSEGIRVLWHRTGIEVRDVRSMCFANEVTPEQLFFWLRSDVPDTSAINPIVALVNTPDVDEIALQFIHND